MTRVAVVVGGGGSLGAALCTAFRRAGFVVAAIGRDLDRLGLEVGGEADLMVAGEVTSAVDVPAMFARVAAEAGPVEVMVYNVGRLHLGPFLQTTPEEFEACWRVNALGAFLCAQAVLPGMLQRRVGALLFSGATASVRGGARSSAFGAGKHALRSLAGSLAREFSPRGVHVAHVVIDGKVWGERTRNRFPDSVQDQCLDPAGLASLYVSLATQPPSVWTLEIDARPHQGRF